MMDIKGLFVWTLESVIRVIQLIWTLKKTFVSYLSITWIMTNWIQGDNRILTITRITWITRFPFISCLDQFCLYFPKFSVNGIPSDNNLKSIYLMKRTSGLCEWLLQSVTQWIDQLDHQSSFVCVSISRIIWINGSVYDNMLIENYVFTGNYFAQDSYRNFHRFNLWFTTSWAMWLTD